AALEDDAERVAIPRGVLHGDEALGPGDPHADDAPVACERVDPRALAPASRDLVLVEIADEEEEVVERIGVLERPIEALEPPFVLEDDLGVEELSELDLAEQLAELRVIDGERLRAALGGGGVLVVDEV